MTGLLSRTARVPTKRGVALDGRPSRGLGVGVGAVVAGAAALVAAPGLLPPNELR